MKKLLLVLGRGIEGCGVTRYALEMQSWAIKNDYVCDVIAIDDRKFGRAKLQKNDIKTVKTGDIKEFSSSLTNYDYVLLLSVPSIKHTPECIDSFFDNIVCSGANIFMSQHDHKMASIARNARIFEIAKNVNGIFTHSLTSLFAQRLHKEGIDTPLYKLPVPFDFDSLTEYKKSFEDKLQRLTYFSRFATFKDPKRMIPLQPLLQKHDIISECRGLERSLGSLRFFHEDPNVRIGRSRPEIHCHYSFPIGYNLPDKLNVYGTYKREEGLEELSKSMFGCDFYNMKAETYGDNIEYAMAEIIAVGIVPVFDKHWAENCKHVDGRRFIDIKDFAIYCDKDNLQDTVDQMVELMNDKESYETRVLSCLRIAKECYDSNVCFEGMLKCMNNCPI